MLIYNRKLSEGPGPSSYGLLVCEAMKLNNNFIKKAKEIQSKLLNQSNLILNNKTVVELKSVKTVNDVMVTQAQNYLRLTGFPEAYLINFPPTLNSQLEVRYVTLD